MKKGFTLIELLVVVLIIGILSAVALPQYTRAVNKSRMATLVPQLKSLLDAGEVYVLANSLSAGQGDIVIPLDSLDIELDDTSFDFKGGKECSFSLRLPASSATVGLVSMCSGSAGIFGITGTGVLFCAPSDTVCKEYGFTKVSSLTAGGDFASIVTGTVYTM